MYEIKIEITPEDKVKTGSNEYYIISPNGEFEKDPVKGINKLKIMINDELSRWKHSLDNSSLNH